MIICDKFAMSCVMIMYDRFAMNCVMIMCDICYELCHDDV